MAALIIQTNTRAKVWLWRVWQLITYLSEAALQRKFGRNLQDREKAAMALMPISRLKVICVIRA